MLNKTLNFITSQFESSSSEESNEDLPFGHFTFDMDHDQVLISYILSQLQQKASTFDVIRGNKKYVTLFGSFLEPLPSPHVTFGDILHTHTPMCRDISGFYKNIVFQCSCDESSYKNVTWHFGWIPLSP